MNMMGLEFILSNLIFHEIFPWILLSLTTNQAKNCQNDDRKFHLQGDRKVTSLISKVIHSLLSSFKSKSFVSLLLLNTKCVLFYFLKYKFMWHTVYLTHLFPSRVYWVTDMMACIFPHVSTSVIRHRSFFVFLDVTWTIYFVFTLLPQL